jgi:hypothetical protein
VTLAGDGGGLVGLGQVARADEADSFWHWRLDASSAPVE